MLSGITKKRNGGPIADNSSLVNDGYRLILNPRVFIVHSVVALHHRRRTRADNIARTRIRFSYIRRYKIQQKDRGSGLGEEKNEEFRISSSGCTSRKDF